ncbi:MAG TPA: hypothetical protein PLX06_09665 [Fimbriimonadaceae bacterium]|nr:hypothetical protein [Fimbriimonadaceae bacterium]
MSKIEFEARQLGRSLGYGIGPDGVHDNAIFDYLNGFMKEADRQWFEEQLAKPGVGMRTRELAESLGVEFGKPSPADLRQLAEALHNALLQKAETAIASSKEALKQVLAFKPWHAPHTALALGATSPELRPVPDDAETMEPIFEVATGPDVERLEMARIKGDQVLVTVFTGVPKDYDRRLTLFFAGTDLGPQSVVVKAGQEGATFASPQDKFEGLNLIIWVDDVVIDESQSS